MSEPRRGILSKRSRRRPNICLVIPDSKSSAKNRKQKTLVGASAGERSPTPRSINKCHLGGSRQLPYCREHSAVDRGRGERPAEGGKNLQKNASLGSPWRVVLRKGGRDGKKCCMAHVTERSRCGGDGGKKKSARAKAQT